MINSFVGSCENKVKPRIDRVQGGWVLRRRKDNDEAAQGKRRESLQPPPEREPTIPPMLRRSTVGIRRLRGRSLAV